jgi:hypothetical protein
MLKRNRDRLQDIDRRNWKLWILAIAIILIPAGGLALDMYTPASATGFSLSQSAMLVGIIGFCALAILIAGYLINRQVVIARLRKELEDEKRRSLERRARRNKELLQTLFGAGQFCDRLALELLRATYSKLPFSGLTISLEVSPSLTDSDEIYSAFGEAVKTMIQKLRGEDSIYQFTSGVFGILLPGSAADVARGVARRMADGLNEAMGISPRYSFDIRITNFPDQAKTAPEMESLMRAPREP